MLCLSQKYKISIQQLPMNTTQQKLPKKMAFHHTVQNLSHTAHPLYSFCLVLSAAQNAAVIQHTSLLCMITLEMQCRVDN